MNGISATRETLKQVFKPGAKPTGRDFARLFDSFVHLTEDGVSVLPERPAVNVGEIQLQGSDVEPAILFGGENRWKLGVNLLDEEGSGGSISFTHAESPTPTLHLTGDGKVGIGTAKPDTTLTIEGGGEAIRLYSGGDRKDSSIGFFCKGGPGSERSGWIGYRDERGPDFSIENEQQPGAIVLTSRTHVAVNSQLQVDGTSKPDGGFITVGRPGARHLALDDTGIQAKNEKGGQTILEVQPAGGETRFGGKVVIGTAKPDTAFTIENNGNGPIRLVSQRDQHINVESQMQVTGGEEMREVEGVMAGGRLTVGKQKGRHIVFDGDHIQALDKTNKAKDLNLQSFGGSTNVGGDLQVAGKLIQRAVELFPVGTIVLSPRKNIPGFLKCDTDHMLKTLKFQALFDGMDDQAFFDGINDNVESRPRPDEFKFPKLKPLSVGGLKFHFFLYKGF